MAKWTLIETRANLRLQLKDSGALWSDPELDRAWSQALGDFGRFYPDETIYEMRVDLDAISAESVTLVAGIKQLAYFPVKWGSVTVTDTDGNACTRGTDYEFNFATGTITRIAGGEIASATETIAVTYTRDNVSIDVSSLTYLRIYKLEYPIGSIPQEFVTFMEFAGNLYFTTKKGGQGQSQSNLVDDQHARLFYYGPHTAPTASVAGTAPVWSEEVILKGAEAYSWLIAAGQYEQQAVTDFGSARSAIDTEIAAVQTLLIAALGAMKTECETANTALDGLSLTAATTALAAGTTTLALITSEGIHTEAETALDKIKTELDLITNLASGNELYDAVNVTDCESQTEGDIYLLDATTPPSMHDYLIDGDDLINEANKGEDVAALMMQYALAAGQLHDKLRDSARLHLERGTLHVQSIAMYVQEVTARLQRISQYMGEAQAEVTIGNGYTASNAMTMRQAEAYIANSQTYARQSEMYIGQIQAYLTEADRYTVLGMQNLELADRFRDMGILRRNEFWAIIGDRSQGSVNRSTSPGNQMPSSG